MAEPRYTAAEKARIALLTARGAARIMRGRSVAAIDRKLDQIERDAQARGEAEERAREAARIKRIQEQGAKRAERRLR